MFGGLFVGGKKQCSSKKHSKCSFISFWEGVHFIYYPLYWSLLHLGVTQQNSQRISNPQHDGKCIGKNACLGRLSWALFFKGRTCFSLLEVLNWSSRKWVRCMEHAMKFACPVNRSDRDFFIGTNDSEASRDWRSHIVETSRLRGKIVIYLFSTWTSMDTLQ